MQKSVQIFSYQKPMQVFFNGNIKELAFTKGQVNFRYCSHIMCSFDLHKNQGFHAL